MRTIHASALLLVLIAVILSGCKKDNKVTPAINPNFPAGLSATINGTPWSGQLCWASIQTGSSAELILNITGWDTLDGKEINLYMDFYQNKTGTYSMLRQGNEIINSADYVLNTHTHQANTGTITLDYLANDSIEGTFSFVTDSFTITNGQFGVGLR